MPNEINGSLSPRENGKGVVSRKRRKQEKKGEPEEGWNDEMLGGLMNAEIGLQGGPEAVSERRLSLRDLRQMDADKRCAAFA